MATYLSCSFFHETLTICSSEPFEQTFLPACAASWPKVVGENVPRRIDGTPHLVVVGRSACARRQRTLHFLRPVAVFGVVCRGSTACGWSLCEPAIRVDGIQGEEAHSQNLKMAALRRAPGSMLFKNVRISAGGCITTGLQLPRMAQSYGSNGVSSVRGISSPWWASCSIATIARHFSIKIPQRKQSTAEKSDPMAPEILATYVGPIASTLYRLKLFSMVSLALASAFTPVFLLAPAEIGMFGRISMSLTALAASGISTGIIGWIGSPYVGRMSLEKHSGSEPRPPAIVATTLTWRLRPLQTSIFEPSLIRPTSRPFASWELPTEPGAGTKLSTRADSNDSTSALRTLVAETRDLKSAKLVGRWWAEMVPGAKSAAGSDCEITIDVHCFGEGKPVRHFQVHEELLGEEWRILG